MKKNDRDLSYRETDDRNTASRRRKKRKRRVRRVLGVLAGIVVTCCLGAVLSWAVVHFLPGDTAQQPTLPAGASASQVAAAAGSSEAAGAGGDAVPSAAVSEKASEEVGTADASQASEGTKAAAGSAESTERAQTGESTVGTSGEETARESTSGQKETSAAAVAVNTPAEETTETDLFAMTDDADYNRRLEAVEKYQNLGVVVNVPHYLNMRSGPSTDAEVCGVIFPYCGLNVLQQTDNGWYLIESGGAEGYVSSKYIQTGKEAVKLATEHCRYQSEVIVDKVAVRKEPSEDSDEITSIVRGDYFDCLSENGDWVEIEIAEDLGGYLPASAVQDSYRMEEAIVFGFDDSVSPIRRNIINTAFEYYGNKYVFGGEDLENGIDCSAFTRAIYGMYGVSLTRNSYTQVGEGKAVEEKDVKPGDLLFYYGRYAGQVGHVAIYIGNGKIIHAASERKGICVSDWKFVPIVAIRDVIPEELDH